MSYNKETGLYEGYIYKITCLVNNKLYIGQTKYSIVNRWAGHKHDSYKKGYKTSISKAIHKYGANNFIIEEIDKIEAESEELLKKGLDEKEIYYIAKYHSLTHENGYNITIGGDNIGIAQKVKTYCFLPSGELVGEFESRAEAGRYIGVTGETVAGAILRKGLCRGYYFTSNNEFDYKSNPHPLSEKKIKAYSFDGKLIKEYNNSFEAAKELGGLANNIYGACKGTHKSAYGFIWRFEEDNFYSNELPKPRTKTINQYSKDNKYINTYSSIKQASDELGLNPPNISGALGDKNKRKTSGGFKWYYADDPKQPDPTKIICS